MLVQSMAKTLLVRLCQVAYAVAFEDRRVNFHPQALQVICTNVSDLHGMTRPSADLLEVRVCLH